MTEGLRITAAPRQNAVIVTASGPLGVRTSPELRDALLEHAADAEDALVVDVDALELPASAVTEVDPAALGGTPPLLSVFTAVWSMLSTWPGIPVHLVAEREPLATQLRDEAVPHSVPVHRTVTDALAAVGAPSLRQRSELSVPAGTPGARAARVWVTGIVTGWNLTAPPSPHRPTSSTGSMHPRFTVDGADAVAREWLLDVVLVASELVENVLRHTVSDALLRLEVRPGRLSIAVDDDDPRPPHVVPFAGAASTGGRGLAVVEHLAHAWGHRSRPAGGKVVWAVLGSRSREE